MLFYTIGQSLAFLLMLRCGVIIALWYDLTGFLRTLFQAGTILSIALDLLFGLGAAAALMASLMSALDGELRLYALMGALCGFLLYSAALSPLLKVVFSHLSRGFRHIGKALLRCGAVKKMLR